MRLIKTNTDLILITTNRKFSHVKIYPNFLIFDYTEKDIEKMVYNQHSSGEMGFEVSLTSDMEDAQKIIKLFEKEGIRCGRLTIISPYPKKRYIDPYKFDLNEEKRVEHTISFNVYVRKFQFKRIFRILEELRKHKYLCTYGSNKNLRYYVIK